jgi:hypothetical protein
MADLCLPYASFLFLCFECIQILDRLLDVRPLPEFHGNTWALVDTISAQSASKGTGRLIWDALQNYFGADACHLKSLRVSVSHQFARDEVVCTLVEWIDRSDARYLAIFTFDPDDHERCNYLVYSGCNQGVKGGSKGGGPESYVYWNLSDLSEMTTLLEAVQHVVGILELSKSDIDVLYCGNRDDTCSTKEYVPF